MKTSECDILIVPGWNNSGPDHWQSRWQSRLPTARRVEQRDWAQPDRDAWVSALGLAIGKARRPVVLVAHSLGVATVIHAAPYVGRRVAAAFLVALPDVDRLDEPAMQRLVEELSAGSTDFTRFWKLHDVLERQGGERGFQHPARGEIHYQQVTLFPGEHEHIKFVLLKPSRPVVSDH